MEARPAPLIVVPLAVPPGETYSKPPLATLVPEARPPLETLTTPLSVVLTILPPDSTLRVPPESTITPVLVCPELTLSVPPLETVGIAKAPGRYWSRQASHGGSEAGDASPSAAGQNFRSDPRRYVNPAPPHCCPRQSESLGSRSAPSGQRYARLRPTGKAQIAQGATRVE
jgi:hypothetical protein